MGSKLTLISAPAGFGKTTLAREWLATLTPAPSFTSRDKSPTGQGKALRVAWLALEEEDSHAVRFIAYMVAALQVVQEGIGEDLVAALLSPQPPPVQAVLTSLINDITASPAECVLILDDYHCIDSKPVDEALTFLIEHLPAQLHLVITSREDPALPLARLRARGQLTELRAADLRFSLEEAAGFLNQGMGLNLTAQDIAALETRTEGWIAGLQLAALSMQGEVDTASRIKSFTGSHRFVLDYLIEEVLQKQPENIQSFLLRTSILGRLSGPLCDAVIGNQEFGDQGEVQSLLPTLDSQSILEYLERANLFIVPLDNERVWFRNHHLFSDILRQRSGERLSQEEAAEHHLRASQWYEKNGELSEAFSHAAAAGAYRRAAELAEAAWEEMNGTFQSVAWLGWVMKLPEDEIRLRPVLSTQMGLAFMDAGNPQASESRLREAEMRLNGLPDEMVVVDKAQLETLPAMIAMARAYNAQVQGDFADTVKYAELALRLIPEDDFFRRAQATITLQITHWASGDLQAARSALEAWIKSMQKAGNYVFAVASAFAVADILVELGQLRAAAHTYRQSLQLAAEHGREAQAVTAHHYLGLALLCHEMGDDSAAADHLQKAWEMGKQSTLVDWRYRWHAAQARLHESRGEPEAALLQLEEASRAYVKNPVPDTRPIEAWKAKLHLKQGRLAQAREWAGERGFSTDDQITYLNEFEHLVLALVKMAEGRNSGENRPIKQAIEMLERMRENAERQSRAGNEIEILITLSLAYQAQENLSSAPSTLERALSLAQPEGYVRIFVDQGEPMRRLLAEFRSWAEKHPGGRSDTLRDYADRLIDMFDEAGKQRAGASRGKAELVEPLSEREQEVLRLIARGLSNTEISQRLVLAMSTVKGHNQRIFRKLQVQNRTEAVSRARELGLL